jgi:hypothetical protein
VVQTLYTSNSKKPNKMKKLLFICIVGVFAACGSNSGVETISDSQSTKIDTSSTGMNSATMPVDTTGAASMNADTTGMSHAR